MYKKVTKRTGGLKINQSMEGETIEEAVKRAYQNGENLESTNNLVYSERKEGVIEAYDIRKDKFEMALDANERVQQDLDLKHKEFMEAKQAIEKGEKREE